jgi:TRAP-type C4-dicarboxylate transport system permease small subunit
VPRSSILGSLGRGAAMLLKVFMAFVLFAMMMLTGIDVVGRYFLNSPVGGADELIATGMALLIFGSLPLVAARSEQITVDIVSTFTGALARSVQRAVVNLIGAVVLGYLGYQLFVLAGKMLQRADHSTYLQIPYAPLVYFMAAAAGLAALATLVLVAAPAERAAPEPPVR